MKVPYGRYLGLRTAWAGHHKVIVNVDRPSGELASSVTTANHVPEVRRTHATNRPRAMDGTSSPCARTGAGERVIDWPASGQSRWVRTSTG